MKKILLVVLNLVISISFVSAQNLVNLNKVYFSDFEEMNSPTEDLDFTDAIRFREMLPNEKIQYDELIQLNDIIQLDLFNDKQYKARVDKVKEDVNGTLLVRAKLEGYDYAYCFISTFEGKSFIVIEVPEEDELYMSRYNHATNTYHLLQMDKTKLNKVEACFGNDDLILNNKPANNNKSFNNSPIIQQSPTTRDTITLLVVYTPAAATWSAANEVSINNTINLMMARAELTNDNSDSLLYIDLVHSQVVNYTELRSVQDLFNLRNTNDGIMDTVHTLRNLYCADLVTLLEQTNHTGGTAFLLNSISGSPSFGFSILRVQQSSWTYTAIHEFGHNLGCGHHKFQNFQAGPGIFSYSAGSRWVSVPSGNFCSVMSYESGTYFSNGISHTRVGHFSNPFISYQGTPTGDTTDADNARSIRTTKSVVAAYRSGCALPSPVTVSGNGGTYCDSVTLTASGGLRGTIYWQDTISGDTSTANPGTTRTVTASGTYYFRAKNFNGWGPEGSSTVTIINNVPSPAGPISGPTNVCLGQTASYSIPPITGASFYVWTFPPGVQGRASSDSITITYTNAAVSGNITVRGTNACGSGVVSTLAVTVNPIPATAGTITGPNNVCLGQTVSYTVPAIANASSYTWTLPSGATGTSSTDSISVTYSNAAVSGNISVKGSNICGIGDSSLLAVTVNPFPANAGAISGPTAVCPGQTVSYTVPAIANASSYTWTLPSGATGTSTTDSINVTYSNAAVSGNISVIGNNSCGSGNSSTLGVTVNPFPANAGAISGPTAVCPGQTVSYTVPAIANASSYTWTLPSGATGTSTTDSINVTYSNVAVSGNITVIGNNSCGSGNSSTLAVTVNPFPANAGTISGPTAVCPGQTVSYTVPAIANASSYTWTLPNGASGTSTTDSINVTYSNAAVSGNITVIGNNSCGSGNSSALGVTVNPLPANAGAISGPTAVCPGQTVSYTLPAIANASSYTWTLPNGATGTSTTDSISVTYSNAAVSGNITVIGNNSCGSGNSSTLGVTVNPLPANAGAISGPTAVCQGDTETYTVPTIANATSYNWTLPSGATGTSTTNSITVNYSASAISGNITVTGTNACGNGSTSALAVTIDTLPATPIISQNGFTLTSNAPIGNQWYNQNGLINGAINQNYTVTTNGTYYAIVTLLGCSSDTSNLINVISTGIEARAKDISFTIFPNPFSNNLTIEIEGNEEMVNLEIMNTSGQLVYKGNMTNRKEIETSNLAKGIYFIKVENARLFEIKKIIRR